MVKRSLLQENKLESGWIFEFQPLILAYLKQQAGDLTEVHERAIAYYHSIVKESAWTIEDITAELEIFYHHCELKQYNQAYKILRFCHDFLSLRGYYTTIIELYSLLETEYKYSDAYILTSLGYAYQSLGEYQIAIDSHQQSLAIYWWDEISSRNVNSLIGLGNAYNSLGEYEEAIDYHQESLDIASEIGNRKGEAASLNNLGNAYKYLGEYQIAIDYNQQSLAIFREIGDRKGEAASLTNLGNAYKYLGYYQIVIDYCNYWLLNQI